MHLGLMNVPLKFQHMEMLLWDFLDTPNLYKQLNWDRTTYKLITCHATLLIVEGLFGLALSNLPLRISLTSMFFKVYNDDMDNTFISNFITKVLTIINWIFWVMLSHQVSMDLTKVQTIVDWHTPSLM